MSRAPVYDTERHRKQCAHGDTENQYSEAQSGIGLHATGEQLGAVLVHTLSVLGFGPPIFERDCAADDGLGEKAGEYKRQHRANRARQEATCDQTLLHGSGLVVRGRSVAGKSE